jgi:hypothetical protein
MRNEEEDWGIMKSAGWHGLPDIDKLCNKSILPQHYSTK